MAIVVWPTEADIGGGGRGQVLSENYFQRMMQGFCRGASGGYGFVISGLGYVNFGGLDYRISTGYAVVLGHFVYVDAITPLTLVNNASNYVRLLVSATSVAPGYRVTDASIGVSQSPTTFTGGPYYIPLSKLVCSGGVVTSAVSYAPTLNTNITTPTWS